MGCVSGPGEVCGLFLSHSFNCLYPLGICTSVQFSTCNSHLPRIPCLSEFGFSSGPDSGDPVFQDWLCDCTFKAQSYAFLIQIPSQSHHRFLHTIRVSILQNKPRLMRWTDPPPMETGGPCPAVRSNGHDLHCAYFINSTVAPVRSVAILKFEGVLQHRFGYPNDETLQGHPLHQFGLEHYGFFTVENSPLIYEIEKQNECHSQHRPGIYTKFCHWIFTFHDETLEVIALRGNVSGQSELPPEKAVCL
jgi:hypothetical protein